MMNNRVLARRRLTPRSLFLSITIIVSLLTPAVSGQTRPSVKELTRAFRDPDSMKRMAAIEVAAAEVEEGRVAALIKDAEFEKALLAVLRDSNNSVRKHLRHPDKTESLEAEEGRGEDLNVLAQVIMPIVPGLSAVRQRAWAHELVRSPYGPYSPFAAWLAEFGDLIVDDLVKQVNHPDMDGDRANAQAVLARMIAVTAAGTASRQTRYPLSVAGRQKALHALRAGLDP